MKDSMRAAVEPLAMFVQAPTSAVKHKLVKIFLQRGFGIAAVAVPSAASTNQDIQKLTREKHENTCC